MTTFPMAIKEKRTLKSGLEVEQMTFFLNPYCAALVIEGTLVSHWASRGKPLEMPEGEVVYFSAEEESDIMEQVVTPAMRIN